jgi:hypothetical protein
VTNVTTHVNGVLVLLGIVSTVLKVLTYMLPLMLLSVSLNVQMDIMKILNLDTVYLVTNLVELVTEKDLLVLTNVLLVPLILNV